MFGDSPLTTKATYWVFTLNNYTEDDLYTIQYTMPLRFARVGKEVAPTTGTPHLQGCVGFKSQIRKSSLMKYLPRCRADPMRGDDVSNDTYCMKEDHWLKVGEATGATNEKKLPPIYEVAHEGAMKKRSYEEMCEIDHRFYMDSNKRCYINAVSSQPLYKGKKRVHWIYGPSGTGKSKFAQDMGAHEVIFDNHFALNYKRTSIVCINELRSRDISFSKLLLLLEPYRPSSVNIKGSECTWDPEVVYITSETPPWEYSTDGTRVEQLLRRINTISMFTHHND